MLVRISCPGCSRPRRTRTYVPSYRPRVEGEGVGLVIEHPRRIEAGGWPGVVETGRRVVHDAGLDAVSELVVAEHRPFPVAYADTEHETSPIRTV